MRAIATILALTATMAAYAGETFEVFITLDGELQEVDSISFDALTNATKKPTFTLNKEKWGRRDEHHSVDDEFNDENGKMAGMVFWHELTKLGAGETMLFSLELDRDWVEITDLYIYFLQDGESNWIESGTAFEEDAQDFQVDVRLEGEERNLAVSPTRKIATTWAALKR
jgi:hypothetical protein